jgi:uncharacterized alpha-E superfamily protein
MLSRVADSIFWMRRYTERAENVARFIDVTLNLTLGLGDQREHQWEALVYTTGDDTLFFESYQHVSQENVIRFLTFDESNPNSILSCLQYARENARQSREMLSSQMWEELNKFYLFVRDSRNDHRAIDSPFEFFTKVRQFGFLIDGVVSGTMSHGEAWNFGRLGAMLERADKTSRILDVKYFLLLPNVSDVGTSIDFSQWGMLLRSASALEMYRRRFGRLSPKLVAAFLLLDRDFPRAVRFCISLAERSLLAITGGTPGNFNNRPEQLLGRLRAELEFLDIDEVMRGGLHDFIDGFQGKLNDIGDAVHEMFFQVQVA